MVTETKKLTNKQIAINMFAEQLAGLAFDSDVANSFTEQAGVKSFEFSVNRLAKMEEHYEKARQRALRLFEAFTG